MRIKLAVSEGMRNGLFFCAAQRTFVGVRYRLYVVLHFEFPPKRCIHKVIFARRGLAVPPCACARRALGDAMQAGTSSSLRQLPTQMIVLLHCCSESSWEHRLQ